MKHTYITLAACLFFTAGMQAQSIDEVLRQIEQNNKELQSQQHATRAAQLEVQTQNNLEDPSVEYSPFYTKGITGMSSSELVVTQGFDFPTLYAARSRSGKLQREALHRQYEATRRDILLNAKNLCLDLVMLNKQQGLLEERKKNADELLALFEKRLEEGDAGILEVNKIKMERMSVQTEVSLNNAAHRTALQQLLAMNGNLPMDFTSRDYPQVEALKKGVDILIACPGRLNDLIGQGFIDLSALEIFVLDEADRMLDMGFVHDVKKVIAKLPAQRQNLMFSATMPAEIEQLAAGILHDPAFVKVDPVSSTVDRIQQSLYYVEKGNKKLLLPWLIKNLQPPVVNALVFSRTKHGADKIAKDLTKQGIPAAAIHGNKSQTARVTALEDFKSGKTRVLVATDIAARGIDISELSHVFNYDLPEVPETYVHRIGRTARAGADGTAVSFCAPEEQEYLAGIEKLNRRKIPVVSGHPWDGVPAPVRPVLPVRGKKPRPEAEKPAEAPKKQAETAPAKAAKAAAPAPKQEPKAAKNAVPAKPKKEETLMQDSNAKRGVRNDRRANNRGANAPKEAAAPRARRENAAPARGSNAQPKFDPHFVSAPEATPLRPARKTPAAPAAPAIRSAQEPQNNQNASRSGSRRNDRSEQRAAQSNNARPARNERGSAGNQNRTGSAPRAPKAEPARRGRNAAARDEDPGLMLISRRPPQQKYTSFEEYMDAHGGATAPIEDHSEEV